MTDITAAIAEIEQRMKLSAPCSEFREGLSVALEICRSAAENERLAERCRYLCEVGKRKIKRSNELCAELAALRSTHATMVERLRELADGWLETHAGSYEAAYISLCANYLLAILAEPQAATDPAGEPKQE